MLFYERTHTVIKFIYKDIDANFIKKKYRKQRERFHQGQGQEIATGAFLNSPSTQPGRTSCVFCSKPHYSASCPEVTNFSKRREMLMRDRLCFLCLRKGHRASECERTTITVANVIDGIINRFVKWRKQNKSKTRCHVRFNHQIHQIRKIYQRMENKMEIQLRFRWLILERDRP